jgi:hypothetical protein
LFRGAVTVSYGHFSALKFVGNLLDDNYCILFNALITQLKKLLPHHYLDPNQSGNIDTSIPRDIQGSAAVLSCERVQARDEAVSARGLSSRTVSDPPESTGENILCYIILHYTVLCNSILHIALLCFAPFE